jgi:hypothetical protein
MYLIGLGWRRRGQPVPNYRPTSQHYVKKLAHARRRSIDACAKIGHTIAVHPSYRVARNKAHVHSMLFVLGDLLYACWVMKFLLPHAVTSCILHACGAVLFCMHKLVRDMRKLMTRERPPRLVDSWLDHCMQMHYKISIVIFPLVNYTQKYCQCISRWREYICTLKIKGIIESYIIKTKNTAYTQINEYFFVFL